MTTRTVCPTRGCYRRDGHRGPHHLVRHETVPLFDLDLVPRPLACFRCGCIHQVTAAGSRTPIRECAEHTGVGRAVLASLEDITRAMESPPARLPCGCPLDSGCTGYHPSEDLR